MKPGDIIQGKSDTAREDLVFIVTKKHRVDGAWHVEYFNKLRNGNLRKEQLPVYEREFDIIEEA